MTQRKPHIELDSAHTDPARVRRERDKARKLRNSNWWRTLLQKGVCHYCEKRFSAKELTMDHVVPIARGGTSTPGNIVPACRSCNQDKKLEMPVDKLFEQLEAERLARSQEALAGPDLSSDAEVETDSDE